MTALSTIKRAERKILKAPSDTTALDHLAFFKKWYAQIRVAAGLKKGEEHWNKVDKVKHLLMTRSGAVRKEFYDDLSAVT